MSDRLGNREPGKRENEAKTNSRVRTKADARTNTKSK